MLPAALFGYAPHIERVYAQGRREVLASRVALHPEIITLENFADHAEFLSSVEVAFSTWGMLRLDRAQLDGKRASTTSTRRSQSTRSCA